MYLLLAAAIAALPRLMFRFSGEDPIKGHPFYHEKITREAARKAGWDGRRGAAARRPRGRRPPRQGTAYVATDDGLCLVDGKTRTLELTLPVGTAPGSVAVDPVSGATFVGDRVDGAVRRVDTAAILG